MNYPVRTTRVFNWFTKQAISRSRSFPRIHKVLPKRTISKIFTFKVNSTQDTNKKKHGFARHRFVLELETKLSFCHFDVFMIWRVKP